jgi:hypothetical protein
MRCIIHAHVMNRGVWHTRYKINRYGGRDNIHYKIDTGNDGYGDLRFVSGRMMELLRNAEVITDKFIVSSGIGLLWIWWVCGLCVWKVLGIMGRGLWFTTITRKKTVGISNIRMPFYYSVSPVLCMDFTHYDNYSVSPAFTQVFLLSVACFYPHNLVIVIIILQITNLNGSCPSYLDAWCCHCKSFVCWYWCRTSPWLIIVFTGARSCVLELH